MASKIVRIIGHFLHLPTTGRKHIILSKKKEKHILSNKKESYTLTNKNKKEVL